MRGDDSDGDGDVNLGAFFKQSQTCIFSGNNLISAGALKVDEHIGIWLGVLEISLTFWHQSRSSTRSSTSHAAAPPTCALCHRRNLSSINAAIRPATTG